MPIEHASDHECVDCGEPAEVFWGLADPDASQAPVCNSCARQRDIKVWENLPWTPWERQPTDDGSQDDE